MAPKCAQISQNFLGGELTAAPLPLPDRARFARHPTRTITSKPLPRQEKSEMADALSRYFVDTEGDHACIVVGECVHWDISLLERMSHEGEVLADARGCLRRIYRERVIICLIQVWRWRVNCW